MVSFQAYINNIKAKTPADFKKMAEKKASLLRVNLTLKRKQQRSLIGLKKNLN
jgi:hypothetical protein